MCKCKSGVIATAVIACMLCLTAGCAGPSAGTSRELNAPARLALKFAPGDSTAYTVIRETDKGVQWEGLESNKPKGFTGGHTGVRIEMAFTQDIRSADAGKAVAKITVRQLRYLAKVKDQVTVDFDGSRAKDLDSPMGKLIGQSYTLELTTSGQVSNVIDAAEARAAVAGDSVLSKIAANLLSDASLKELHAFGALPAAGQEQVGKGQTWSTLESFSFDLMGAKAYEKVYTLEEISNAANRQIAVAKMKAVPSAEMAKELHKEQSAASFSNMFDNTETFTGDLKFDLTGGKVQQWSETLQNTWFIVDPNPKEQQAPAALRMTATRLHSIEQIN